MPYGHRTVPRKRSKPKPTPAPVVRPDVTLGGDRHPRRSGHARAQTISVPRPDVTLSGDRHGTRQYRTGHDRATTPSHARAARRAAPSTFLPFTKSGSPVGQLSRGVRARGLPGGKVHVPSSVALSRQYLKPFRPEFRPKLKAEAGAAAEAERTQHRAIAAHHTDNRSFLDKLGDVPGDVGHAVGSAATSAYVHGIEKQAQTPNFHQLKKDLYGIAKVATGVQNLKTGHFKEAGVPHPERIGIAAETAVEKAAVHPVKTSKSFVHSLPGMIGGVGALAVEPQKTVRKVAHDYSKRYGPYFSGKQSTKSFRKQVDKDPLPYALDVFASGIPAGKIAGGLAHTTEALRGSSAATRAFTRPRPELRVASGVARPQRLSQNLIGLAGQRAVDVARRKHTAAMAKPGRARPARVLAREAEASGQVITGLTSKRRILNASQQVEQTHRARFVRERARSLSKSHREIRKLLPQAAREHGGFWAAVERGVRTPEQARAMVASEKARIEGARQVYEQQGEKFPHDVVKQLDEVAAHADEWFGPNMKKAAILAKRAGGRGAELDPYLHGNMRARVMEPVARELGVRPHEYLNLDERAVQKSIERNERLRTKQAGVAAGRGLKDVQAELKTLAPTGPKADIRRQAPLVRARAMDDEALQKAIEHSRASEQRWYSVAEKLPKGKDADLGKTLEVASLAQGAAHAGRIFELEAKRRGLEATKNVSGRKLDLMRRPFMPSSVMHHGSASDAPLDLTLGKSKIERPFHAGDEATAQYMAEHRGNWKVPDNLRLDRGDVTSYALQRGAKVGRIHPERRSGKFDKAHDAYLTHGSEQFYAKVEDSIANDIEDLVRTAQKDGISEADRVLNEWDRQNTSSYIMGGSGESSLTAGEMGQRRKLWERYKNNDLDVIPYRNAMEDTANLADSYVVLRPSRAGRPLGQGNILTQGHDIRAELAARTVNKKYAPESGHAYRGRVARELRAQGRAMPGYFRHETEPYGGMAEHTLGHGQYAPGAHPSTAYKAFETGRHSVTDEAWAGGVARNFKRKFAQDFIQNMVREFTPKFIHDPEGNRVYGGRALTRQAARSVRRRAAISDSEYVLVNLNEVKRGFTPLQDPLELTEGFMDNLAGSLEKAKIDPSAIETITQEGRWYFMDRAAYERMQSSIAAQSHITGRILRRFAKGIPSKLILGANPSWLALQVVNNQGLLALNGIPPWEAAQTARLMRDLKRQYPEEYDTLMSRLGAGGLETELDAMNQRMGAPGQRALENLPDPVQAPLASLGHFWQRWRESTYAPGGRHLNLQALFKGDALNNWLAKSMAARNHAQVLKMKGMEKAYDNMIGATDRMMANFQKMTPAEMAKMIRDPRAFEDIGRANDDLLGNYSRFTPRERQFLESNIMFYGFLRFSLRFTLYTLPIKHPIVHSILNRLSALHEDEVRRLFDVKPGDPLPGWFLGSIYKEHGGKVFQLPLSRLNPMLNQLTQATGAHPAQALTMFSPLFVELGSQLTGFNPFTGKGWHPRANPRLPIQNLADPRLTHMSLEERGRIALRHAGEWASPFRAWETAATGGRAVTEESLPWDVRPFRYKDEGARAGIAQRQRRYLQEAGKTLPRTLGDPVYSALTGNWAPSQGKAILKYLKEQERRALGKKARGSGGYTGGGLGGGGGGGSLGGGM